MWRVSPGYILTIPVFLLLGWTQIQLWGFLLLPTSLGIVFGMLAGGSLSLRALRVLAEKGEYRTTREQTIAGLAVDIVTALGALLLMFWLLSLGDMRPIGTTSMAVSFFLPAFYGIQGVIFFAWETKKGKRITSEGHKLYAVHKHSAY